MVLMVERVVVRRRRTRVEARLEVPRVKVPLRLRRLRRRPVVLGDVDLEALTGGVVLVAVDALEGPVVVQVVELVLAAVHVRLQVPLGRRHVGALWRESVTQSAGTIIKHALCRSLTWGQCHPFGELATRIWLMGSKASRPPSACRLYSPSTRPWCRVIAKNRIFEVKRIHAATLEQNLQVA